MAEYTCKNYGNCANADDRRSFTLADTGAPACPSCGSTNLKKVSSGSGANAGGDSRKPVFIMLAILASLAAGAAVFSLRSCSTAEKQAQEEQRKQEQEKTEQERKKEEQEQQQREQEKQKQEEEAKKGKSSLPPANPELFGVIEIGGKGVKGVVVDLVNALNDENCKKDQEVFSDCLLRKKFDPYNVTPLVKASIGDAAKAAKTIMDEMTNQFTVDPSQIYVVGSSSVNKVEHKLELKKAIEDTLGNSMQMDFIDADLEGAYDFQGVLALLPETWGKNTHWRDKRQKEVVVLDIGSGNSKGGYMEVVGDEKRFVSFEMKYGTKSFSDMVSKQGGNFKETSANLRKNELQPAIKELVGRKPGMINRDRVYLLGGISWTLSNLVQPRNKLHFPPIYPAHFDTLYGRAIAPDAEKRLCSQNPDRDVNKDIQKICDIFTINDVIAGMDLMKTFSEEMRFKNKHVFFMRDSLYAWPLGYLKARCESEGKC